MRHRSRSRNYDSNDNYKSRRSPVKYESSRSHKSKVVHSHYSSESRKHSSNKIKKSTDRSRYDNHKDRDSESEDKFEKKVDSNFERDNKKSKYSKYTRGESPGAKHPRKYDDYTHSYRRRSVSSDLSYHSYDSKYKKFEEKSDKKNYKSTKEHKRIKVSKSLSSDQLSDMKVKSETNKEKTKDKKVKKKSKKSDKDKEKKKRKRQKHSSDEEMVQNTHNRHMEDKSNANKSSKHDDCDDDDCNNKAKLKLEPFKVKESSNLKSQINFLNSSNIFTKDEWQKESSDDDLHKKHEEAASAIQKKNEENKDNYKKIKKENYEVDFLKNKGENYDEINKKSNAKKQKSEEKDSDKERSRKRRHRASQSKTRDGIVRSSKHRDTDDDKSFLKSNYENSMRKERSHSYNKICEGSKIIERKEKVRSSKDYKNIAKGVDDKKKVDDIFEDERIELPRTPTDAQYTGLFARLQEEPVSDTEIEDILPPILLDDRMKALLVNDPNVIQEAWDSEDDVLLNKRENIVAPKHRGVLETLAVPWKILIGEASLNKNKQERNIGLSKFTVSNLLGSIGISKHLSGDILLLDIQKHCSNTFLNPIAPIHQTLMSQKSRRNSIFCERGLFAGALSARKDLFIRRVLYEPMI